MNKILLLVAGCLLGLAVAEVLARLGGFGREFFARDATIGYALTPNFSRVLNQFEAPEWSITTATNNLGLRRDGDTTLAKPTGTRRVLVLGDSQTEGIVANADSYPALLEQMLAGGKVPVEVINGGVSGYSPLLEYLWLRERGVRLQPDIVVLALYTGNDLGELTAHEVDFAGWGPRMPIPTMVRDGGNWTILRPGAPSWLAEVDAWLQARLRAYALLRTRIGKAPREGVESLGRVAQQCAGCLQAMWQQWLAQERPEAFDEAALELREILGRFRALAAELGARPLVLIVPTKLEVEEDTVVAEVAEARKTLGLRTEPRIFAETVRAQILAACAAQKLEVIDLLPRLRQARQTGGKPLYWSIDWHLNVEGHRAVAEVVEPRLGELLAAR